MPHTIAFLRYFLLAEVAAETLLRLIKQENVVQEVETRSSVDFPRTDGDDGRLCWGVIAEGTRVARTATLPDALLLIGIARYVFNQKTRAK